jgi:hypothetical protein
MNRIAQLGDEILEMQKRTGLSNPGNLNPGLTPHELSDCPLFQSLPSGSELRDLYAWRNGSKPDVPMGKLWIVPGHYFITAQRSVLSNRYMADKTPDWRRTWFPIMSSGSSDFHFIDTERSVEARAPVFYSDPEFSPGLWQIYDGVETMLQSILKCYAEAAYFLRDGSLYSDARRETAVCGRLNPTLDHWCRKDLF